MAVELNQENNGRVLNVKITNTLHREDYGRFAPCAENLINRHGKIRILVEMLDFHGWDVGGLWEDIKFDTRHFSDIERLALVGDKRWEKRMSFFCKPFTTAQIKYFDAKEKDKAKEWIQEGLPAAT